MKFLALAAGVIVLGTMVGLAMPAPQPAGGDAVLSSEDAADDDDKFGAFLFEYRRTVQVSPQDFAEALQLGVEHVEATSDEFAEQAGAEMRFATDSDGRMNWVMSASGRGRITFRTRVSAEGDGAVFTARVYAATARGRPTSLEPREKAEIRESLEQLVVAVEADVRRSLGDSGDAGSSEL